VRTHTNTAQDTEDFGWQLACARPGAQVPLSVLYLTGEVGAGKTTFARGFLRALGVIDPVRSPTYTLVDVYPLGAVTLVHVDLYRLRSPSELESLGLREWARPGHVWLIEWPEKGEGRLPAPDLTLEFTVEAAGHDIRVSTPTALGKAWLVQLMGEEPPGQADEVEKHPPSS
jgi:tRNA threonylcarbamoyl adenosine modification protein YjeE